MTTEKQIGVPDITAGNAGFVIAQAVLKALLARNVIAVDDVAPMIREVVAFYRRPPAPGREAISSSLADVLEAVIESYQPTRKPAG